MTHICRRTPYCLRITRPCQCVANRCDHDAVWRVITELAKIFPHSYTTNWNAYMSTYLHINYVFAYLTAPLPAAGSLNWVLCLYLQYLAASMAHLACRLATSARNPIRSACADYVPARMDTFAVTTCVVSLYSFRDVFCRGDCRQEMLISTAIYETLFKPPFLYVNLQWAAAFPHFFQTKTSRDNCRRSVHAGCPSCHPTKSVRALKELQSTDLSHLNSLTDFMLSLIFV